MLVVVVVDPGAAVVLVVDVLVVLVEVVLVVVDGSGQGPVHGTKAKVCVDVLNCHQVTHSPSIHALCLVTTLKSLLIVVTKVPPLFKNLNPSFTIVPPL